MIGKYDQLPTGIRPYGRSPVFTSETVPKKLLSAHNLKAGTWGLLTVTQGSVTYFRDEAQKDGKRITPETAHLILPEVLHFIEVSEDAKFYIEFCSTPKPDTEIASSPCSAHENLEDD